MPGQGAARRRHFPGADRGTIPMKVIPISLAQERLWVLEQLAPGQPAYTVSQALRLPSAINESALEQSLSEIIRRHEVLRTTFPAAGGEPSPVVSAPPVFNLPVVDLRNLLAHEREQGLRTLAAKQARQP